MTTRERDALRAWIRRIFPRASHATVNAAIVAADAEIDRRLPTLKRDRAMRGYRRDLARFAARETVWSIRDARGATS